MAHTTREHKYDQPGFHLLPIVALPVLCVGSGRKGRQRAQRVYSRCDCHFLHLDPLHYTAPFCTLILFTTLLPFALALA
jgi:hypothetical protein